MTGCGASLPPLESQSGRLVRRVGVYFEPDGAGQVLAGFFDGFVDYFRQAFDHCDGIVALDVHTNDVAFWVAHQSHELLGSGVRTGGGGGERGKGDKGIKIHQGY